MCYKSLDGLENIEAKLTVQSCGSSPKNGMVYAHPDSRDHDTVNSRLLIVIQTNCIPCRRKLVKNMSLPRELRTSGGATVWIRIADLILFGTSQKVEVVITNINRTVGRYM